MGRLQSCGVTSLAMVSTGAYWIPAFEILKAHGFEVILVNARYAKNVPGRKTDVSDAGWLRQLHSYGTIPCRCPFVVQNLGTRFSARSRRHAAQRAKGNDTSHRTVIQRTTMPVGARLVTASPRHWCQTIRHH